jgi:hypothetical protein
MGFFLKLTRPGGSPVWLRAGSILRIVEEENEGKRRTKVELGSLRQDVLEDVETVVAMADDAAQ